MQQAQTQFNEMMARISALEEHVRALEQANATLRQEMRALQMPRAPQSPRDPHWSPPQTNELPHLTPLESK
jgi:hypothetical protein